MAKTIFFNIPATGHVNPSLPVIKELVERGEEVICVNTTEYKDKIEATGAHFYPYPDMGTMEQLIKNNAGDGNIPRNMRDLIRVAMTATPFASELIADEKPDYIIFDTLARWGKLAAKKHNLPQVSFCSTFVISADAMPPFPLPAILDTVGKMLVVLPSYIADAIKMTAQQGIFPGFLTDAVMSTGDLTLVFTSEAFQPAGENFSEDYKFVGTSIAARPQDSDFPFEQLTGDKLVYISLGTLAHNPDFLKQCLTAFADCDAQFVLSAGKQTNIAGLGTLPDNFIVRNFVPQLEILERADAFITHGGLNSVHESLVYAVPMLVLPQQVEQGVVALEVEKHEAGIALATAPPYKTPSVESLREKLNTILASDKYKTNAAKLGQTLTTAGGYLRAADEIQKFLAKHP